jgi:hypothetical protein
MATLSNPNFQVDILTGMPNSYRVTGTVNVQLSQFDRNQIRDGLRLELQSKLWGDDGGLAGADDLLYSFPSRNITAPGTYTFSAIVPRSVLNEDSSIFDNRDEIYNRFSLVSRTNLNPLNISINSRTITGQF